MKFYYYKIGVPVRLLLSLLVVAGVLAGTAKAVHEGNISSPQQEQEHRILQRIQSYGGTPPASRLPLQLCEGYVVAVW